MVSERRHSNCIGRRPRSRSETGSDYCISIKRRDQVHQLGWCSGGPTYTAGTQCTAWQAAIDSQAAKRLHDLVVISQQPCIRLCWGLTVVTGCHRLEDQRKQRCSSLASCEPEQWQERLVHYDCRVGMIDWLIDWLIEHSLTSPPTQYRLYGHSAVHTTDNDVDILGSSVLLQSFKHNNSHDINHIHWSHCIDHTVNITNDRVKVQTFPLYPHCSASVVTFSHKTHTHGILHWLPIEHTCHADPQYSAPLSLLTSIPSKLSHSHTFSTLYKH